MNKDTDEMATVTPKAGITSIASVDIIDSRLAQEVMGIGRDWCWPEAEAGGGEETRVGVGMAEWRNF